MTFVLDASTLINLANGGVLRVVLTLPEALFFVSSKVRDESASVAPAIDLAVANGHLLLSDDRLIDADEFASEKRRLNLGEGETECILVAREAGHTVACDDGAGRTKASQELGENRVTGSIGLLKRACDAGIISAGEARAAYDLMVAQGGFLPPISEDYFG